MLAGNKKLRKARKKESKNSVDQDFLSYMDEFATEENPIHPPEKIQADKDFVLQQRSRSAEKNKTDRGVILEELLHVVLAHPSVNLFDISTDGQNFSIFKTAEYDDRKHHVDFLFEYDNGDENTIKLAVDCTVSNNPERLERKADYSIKAIDAGTATKIDYFDSSFTGEKMMITHIPRIIFALRTEGFGVLLKRILPLIKKVNEIDDLSDQIDATVEERSRASDKKTHDFLRSKEARLETEKNKISAGLQQEVESKSIFNTIAILFLERFEKQIQKQLNYVAAKKNPNEPITTNLENILKKIREITTNRVGRVTDQKQFLIEKKEINECLAILN